MEKGHRSLGLISISDAFSGFIERSGTIAPQQIYKLDPFSLSIFSFRKFVYYDFLFR